MALEDLAGWLAQITPWSNIALVGAAIYFLWLTFKGGEHGRGHEEALEKSKEAGRALGSWLKGKGAIPFTEEHREKFGRIGGKYGKRAFSRTMSEIIVERKEYQRIEDLSAEVELVNKDKIAVQAKATTKKEFSAFESKAAKLKKYAEKVYKYWKKVKRTTFRQQVVVNDVIAQLSKIPDIDTDKVKELKAIETRILTQHKATEEKLEKAVAEIELLEDAAKQASAAFGSTMVLGAASSLPAAKAALNKVDLNNVKALIDECIELQGDKTNTGVLSELTAIAKEVKSLL